MINLMLAVVALSYEEEAEITNEVSLSKTLVRINMSNFKVGYLKVIMFMLSNIY